MVEEERQRAGESALVLNEKPPRKKR